MTIRIPPPLKAGDTIAVTAPSFGCFLPPYRARYECAKSKMVEAGFRVLTGETVFKTDGKGIATDPRVAAKELESLYCSGDCQAVFSAGGGEMMCETVGHVDFRRLADAPPKWFCGYSDNTNFIFPLATIAHTASLYGPCFPGFGKVWERSEQDALDLVQGKTMCTQGPSSFIMPAQSHDEMHEESVDWAGFVWECNAKTVLRYAHGENGAQMSGIMLGGCLDVLATLCGTRLDVMRQFNAEAGSVVWAIESCDGSPAQIRRQVWQLKNAGWFDNTAGFLVGRPLAAWGCEAFGIDQYNATTDILGELGMPVVMDCPFGHTDPAMPLVIGAVAHVSAQGNELCVRYEL